LRKERVNAGLVLWFRRQEFELPTLLWHRVVAVYGYSSKGIAMAADSKLQDDIVAYIDDEQDAGNAGEGQSEVSLQHDVS
jgi:hypothetical protein